eukprot:3821622-Pyramimonas_sp.AAC.1
MLICQRRAAIRSENVLPMPFGAPRQRQAWSPISLRSGRVPKRPGSAPNIVEHPHPRLMRLPVPWHRVAVWSGAQDRRRNYISRSCPSSRARAWAHRARHLVLNTELGYVFPHRTFASSIVR